MMNRIVTWHAVEYPSIENCEIHIDDHGLRAVSAIEGIFRNEPFTVQYVLSTDEHFATRMLLLKANYCSTVWTISLLNDKSVWYMNEEPHTEFRGCAEVDIATTPFTNTLPVRRLSLDVGEEQEIRVIYFDLFEGAIKALSQKYRRLSENTYHYENIPNDFEADIEVDTNGLVLNYPGLFYRAQKSAD
jgi:hypothetical protein